MTPSKFFRTLLAGCFSVLASASVLAADGDSTRGGAQPTVDSGTAGRKWFLALPKEERVTYLGTANYDGVTAPSHQMLYPAPNFGGFLAAVLTHGLLSETSKKQQSDKIKEKADQSISGYKAVLEKFDHRTLMQQALKLTTVGSKVSLTNNSDEHKDGTIIESMPVFSITTDQAAIILDNQIVIRIAGGDPEKNYRNTVRVVSTSRKMQNPLEYWTAKEGKQIKDESAQLVAESFNIAIHDYSVSKLADVPFKTIRYMEGAVEKMERAKILSSKCGRLLLLTLRGTLMSVPVSNPSFPSPTDCVP